MSHTGSAEPVSYVAGVHFPEVRADIEGLRLTMVATCRSVGGQQEAESLFRSIRFTE